MGEIGEITELLRNWKDGDTSAEEKLWPVVYAELHRLAQRSLRAERNGHTLQTTALVNEAYLRFLEQRQLRFQDRNHFFAISARIMRRVLVDYARERAAAKRGGGAKKVRIATEVDAPIPAEPEVVAVDEALNTLEQVDGFKARLVELRFFGGLTHAEVGEVLGCSETTVRRHWSVAKAWLRNELGSPEGVRAS